MVILSKHCALVGVDDSGWLTVSEGEWFAVLITDQSITRPEFQDIFFDLRLKHTHTQQLILGSISIGYTLPCWH